MRYLLLLVLGCHFLYADDFKPFPDVITTPDLAIAPRPVDNLNEFTQSFFTQFFPLKHAAQPLTLTKGLERDYLFPTLYDEVRTAMLVSMGSYHAVRALIPDMRIRPLKFGDRTPIILSSFRYGKVTGLNAYNEVAVAVLVEVGPPTKLPPITQLLEREGEFGLYVLHMPVTTTENRIRGEKIWGLPKVEREIDLVSEAGDYVTRVKEQVNGKFESYLEFTVPLAGIRFAVKEKTRKLFSIRGRELLESASITAAGKATLGKIDPAKTYVKFGKTPTGRWLESLEIGTHPLIVRFSEKGSSALTYPEKALEK
jgi:hypothetical protein